MLSHRGFRLLLRSITSWTRRYLTTRLFDIFRSVNLTESLLQFLWSLHYSQVNPCKPIVQIAKHFQYFASWYNLHLVSWTTIALQHSFQPWFLKNQGVTLCPIRFQCLRSPAKSISFLSVLNSLQLLIPFLAVTYFFRKPVFTYYGCSRRSIWLFFYSAAMRLVFSARFLHCDDSFLLCAQF